MIDYGFDSETTGVDLYHGARPFYVVICDTNYQLTGWLAEVDPFTREPQWGTAFLRKMRDQFSQQGVRRVGQNTKFDIPMLDSIMPGIAKNWDWDSTEDTLISAHLLKSNERHDLTSQSLIYLDHDLRPVERALEEAVQAARRLCRTKDFIARHGHFRIAKEGDPLMPSAKEKTWKYDMWLPRAVAKSEWELTGDPEWAPDVHPWWHVLTDYSNPDAEVLIPLADCHKRLVKERDLLEIYIERMRLLPQLIDMEGRGASLHEGRLTELEERFYKASKRAEQICLNLASTYDNFELTLPKNGMNNSLREFLFDKMGLVSPIKTDSGAPSFDRNVVEHFMLTLPTKSSELRFVERLSEKRSADTALGYATSYRKYMLPQMGDYHRIHSKINPTGTDTLRNSSQDPNSQQVSKKERDPKPGFEWNFNMRYAFGPLPGREWWSIDYDNLELRIAAYESGEQVMIDIFEKPNEPPYFGSYHLLNASIVYPELFWPLAETKGAFKEKYNSTYYQWIKNFDFADQYGSIPESGTADRAAHKPGAQLMVQKRLKEKTKLNNKWIDYANRWGFVETIPDVEVNPRRGYPIYCTRSNWGSISPTVPLNYHIQSTACWVKMRAMLKVEEYLRRHKLDAYIILEIHDELIFDFPAKSDKGNQRHVNNIRDIMASLGNCVGIPLTCGVSFHPENWAMSA